MQTPLPYFEYVDPAETEAAGTLGMTSISGAMSSMFSIQAIMNLFMHASMGFLWGLVNSLQVLLYESMLAVQLPAIFIAFTEYMNIISGAKESSESLVPEFVEFYVNSTKIFNEK